MKLILTHEVTGLGAAGDIVEVKDGYGRNFLMPRGLATPWTKGGQKQVDALTKGRAVREIKDLDTAKGVKGQLEATSVKVPAKSGQSGRLFGAVSNGDIAHLSPLIWRHLNFLGRYDFSLPDTVLNGGLRPLRNPISAWDF